MAIDWNAVQALATVGLLLTSGGAILYAAMQLQHEREYRSIANLERQWGFFLSANFQQVRRKLAEDRLGEGELKELDTNDPPVSALEVLDFFEHVALLVKRRHLQVYDVWHTFYEWAQPVYADLRPIIENTRSEYADHYSDLRKLMRQMDAIQQKRMQKPGRKEHRMLWTPQRVREHYRQEMEVSGPLRRRSRVTQ